MLRFLWWVRIRCWWAVCPRYFLTHWNLSLAAVGFSQSGAYIEHGILDPSRR
jgi:hypothetical protein